MERNVIILFDSFDIRPEAIDYAVELADRTESGLVFLMLLPLNAGEEAAEKSDGFDDLEAQVDEMLKGYMKSVSDRGIEVEATVRMGDPYSELMKFMAGKKHFQNIVWAGDRESVSRKTKRGGEHWLAKTQGTLKCPVIVPTLRS